MSTGGAISKSRGASSLRKELAQGGQVAAVFSKKPRRRETWRLKADKRPEFPGCNEDSLNQILQYLMNKRDYLPIIKLMMVNKWFKEVIEKKFTEVWRPIYMAWRSSFGRYSSLTYLNFRPRVVRPKDYTSDTFHMRNLPFFRKTSVLMHVRCCGMCGCTRHSTQVFWSLNMRLCRSVLV
jgi:hypothetical protein